MNAMTRYYENLKQVLDTAFETQAAGLETAARWFSEATLIGKNIFAFGCSHAGLLALELYYRTGGMVNINPVRAPGMNLDVDPVTMTTQMERMPGYGAIIADSQPIGAGDVALVHSVSGRNCVPIDFALRCREKGARVIALTSFAAGRASASRHSSGKHLVDVADLALDNCGCVGDGSTVIEGVPEKVGPTSTAVGSAMLNVVVARAVELIAGQGEEAPVFMSANVDGGDAHNERMLSRYRDNVFYMGHPRREELPPEQPFWGYAKADARVRRLFGCLLQAWAADTCAPRMRDRWSPEDPTVGQCSVTAFLAQDLLGGEVWGIALPDGGYHCFNAVGRMRFDLTSAQFSTRLDYGQAVLQTREAHFEKREKYERYLLLKERLMPVLKAAGETAFSEA